MATRAVDLMHQGNDRVICAYVLNDGLIVDPGPSSCLDTLMEGLGDVEPRALMLTHIHLDHAGAAGSLAARFPDLQVFVHEIGAPHLVDPSRLVESASRLYGDAMEQLWGAVEPVPEDRIHVLKGGESVSGLLVAPTPGHASHHVSYLSEDGDAFVGDVAGVRVPPHERTLAPTPPPEIDVEAWLDSLHTVAAWDPSALCLTHFGRVTDVEDQLHRVRTSLLDNADLARREGEEAFIRDVERESRELTDEVAADRLRQAAPTDQLYMGLERYWRKRSERESAA